MRYPQEGGLTSERQQFREELRLRAAERFTQGEASSVITKDLRVSVRSVQRWRQAWDEGGPRALRPRGRHRQSSSREPHLICCHLSPHLGGTSDVRVGSFQP
ncbi:helix-turn-helix domain-containing protein [Streptomyces sp. NPDC015032]|uniref:helix-turn-helix domain-containing protein n=1 Tax=Streptomyces sp. NPDC015032 TaxID=3364937 RepID=UPI0036FC683B